MLALATFKNIASVGMSEAGFGTPRKSNLGPSTVSFLTSASQQRLVIPPWPAEVSPYKMDSGFLRHYNCMSPLGGGAAWAQHERPAPRGHAEGHGAQAVEIPIEHPSSNLTSMTRDQSVFGQPLGPRRAADAEDAGLLPAPDDGSLHTTNYSNDACLDALIDGFSKKFLET